MTNAGQMKNIGERDMAGCWLIMLRSLPKRVAARQSYWIQVCLEKLHIHFMRSMDLRKAVMGLSRFWNSR